jgi:hypothetical protein
MYSALQFCFNCYSVGLFFVRLKGLNSRRRLMRVYRISYEWPGRHLLHISSQAASGQEKSYRKT